ncbi:putative 2OG-Fe(II) oxygenase [Neptuniibacter sp. QD34_54]|uniref:putative 2OG-Fe(II) oxygenase n=1 Tax=Neptuniibacter sp. QD34_54 TaxID=3398208 RepID=UPI0039F4ED6D
MPEKQRTRRLRKYEADPKCSISAPSNETMQLLSPFGPLIAKTKLPSELIEKINLFADQHISETDSTEFMLPEEIVFGGAPSLADIVGRLINNYVKEAEGSQLDRAIYEVFWIVSQYQNTPSPVHFHSGDISGVLFLKVPDEIDPSQEERNYISGRKAGYLNFIEGNKQRFSKSLLSVKPEVGDFYLFPGWLLHGAEPFIGEGERRSMAFNATLKVKYTTT